jgi:hypothetical protein
MIECLLKIIPNVFQLLFKLLFTISQIVLAGLNSIQITMAGKLLFSISQIVLEGLISIQITMAGVNKTL